MKFSNMKKGNNENWEKMTCHEAHHEKNFKGPFQHTPQTVYKVPICPRGNLLYIQIYFTNNTSNKVEKTPISLLLNEYLAQH